MKYAEGIYRIIHPKKIDGYTLTMENRLKQKIGGSTKRLEK
jgi:hypothetical protein